VKAWPDGLVYAYWRIHRHHAGLSREFSFSSCNGVVFFFFISLLSAFFRRQGTQAISAQSNDVLLPFAIPLIDVRKSLVLMLMILPYFRFLSPRLDHSPCDLYNYPRRPSPCCSHYTSPSQHSSTLSNQATDRFP
jgi:hypothetical protein